MKAKAMVLVRDQIIEEVTIHNPLFGERVWQALREELLDETSAPPGSKWVECDIEVTPIDAAIASSEAEGGE